MQEYTVLFVDDEPFILNAMQRLFHEDRIKVVLASSGQEALELLRKRTIQVLVTDNLMPGMTGVDLVRSTKECAPDTIRIILSGYSDMEAVLQALNDGEVFRFVLKPWVDLDLKATVHLALAQYHLIEQHRKLQEEVTTLRPLVRTLQDRYPEIYRELMAGGSTITGDDHLQEHRCDIRT
jgi:YesN/AraC family two-component response regulator